MTNVYTVGALPAGFVNNGTNGWTYNPAGVAGTNNVQFYAVDNLGAVSTTNNLELISTNVPVLFPPVLIGITSEGANVVLDGLVSPGYTHTPLVNTNLATTNWYRLDSYATNVPFLGGTNLFNIQWTLPVDSNAAFYRVLSE